MIQTTTSRRELHLDGIFDEPAARRVREMLESAAPSDRVRVDLTRVREFYDFGVAALADALSHAVDRDVEVLGLRQHQVRLLQYLGVSDGVLAPYRLNRADFAG